MFEKYQTDPKPAKFSPPAQTNFDPHNQIQNRYRSGNTTERTVMGEHFNILLKKIKPRFFDIFYGN